MKRLLRALNFLFGQYPRRWLNLKRGFGIKQTIPFMLDDLLGRSRHQCVQVDDMEIMIRTGCHDANILIHNLVLRDYEGIQCDPPPEVIMDLGAHVGTLAIYFARRYPDAKVIAVEPESENYELLVANTANFDNIIPVNAAVWSKSGRRSILDRGTGPSGYTIVDEAPASHGLGQHVTCLSVPELMAQFNCEKIDLLKLDIEGAEKHVLEHSDDWIERVRIITVELHDRIVFGCDRAFYLATQNFARFDKTGEKVTAYSE